LIWLLGFMVFIATFNGETQSGNQKLDNPDTLATLGTQDTEQTVGGNINGREN
jgi:hypothetical protein